MPEPFCSWTKGAEEGIRATQRTVWLSALNGIFPCFVRYATQSSSLINNCLNS